MCKFKCFDITVDWCDKCGSIWPIVACRDTGMFIQHIDRDISIQADVLFDELLFTPMRSVIPATQKGLACMPVLAACSGAASWVWALWADDSPCSASSHSTMLGPGSLLIAGAGACDYRKPSYCTDG